jgi:beta-barrel assembly-enhancing protease
MSGAKLMLGLVLGILMVVSPASGIEVPQLSQVPQDISPPAREELLRQRSDLEGEWKVLSAKVEGHNQKCRRIPSDTPLAGECREAMARLHGDLITHVDSVKKFNEDVKWALKWKALQKELVVPFLSEKEEIRVGREMAGHLEKQMTLMTDPQVSHYLQMLLQRLASRSTRPGLPYAVKVVIDDEMNAFALPGGHIYLNDGLIRAAANESELAGVLAHEIAHSAARHHAREISKIAHSIGASVVGGVLTGPATAFGLLSQQMIQEGAYLKFARDEEREADRLAVEMLYQAGIKPTGLTSFFERLRREQTEKEGIWNRFYSTHPSPEERKEDLAPLFADPRFNQTKQVDSADFQNIRSKF